MKQREIDLLNAAMKTASANNAPLTGKVEFLRGPKYRAESVPVKPMPDDERLIRDIDKILWLPIPDVETRIRLRTEFLTYIKELLKEQSK